MSGLRESKKRETRLRISDVATMLFLERGFDVVTVDEVAAAARVSKVTVFNYFARKEDLFFDRGSEDYEMIRQALVQREPGVSVLRALQLLVHRLVKDENPFVAFDVNTAHFWRTAKESPALRARARELRAELERALTVMLQEAAGRDVSAPLVAGMLTSAWCVAFSGALRRLRAGGTPAASRKEFLRTIDMAFDILSR